MTGCFLLSGARILLPDRILESGKLVAQEGFIRWIGDGEIPEKWLAMAKKGEIEEFDCCGKWISPPLTELHIHGAFGYGFETAMDGLALRDVAQRLEAKGVGRFMPTILWDEDAVKNLAAAIDDSGLYGSVIPGIYMEGPFINPRCRGGIGLEQIRRPDVPTLERVLDICSGKLSIMTLAPELPGIEALYPILRKAGVMIAAGHSDAKLSTRLPPKPWSVTHLFNAMSPFDHKEGGLVNIAFEGGADWVELNADGVHVNPQAMRAALRCIDPASLILTSDAVAPAGLEFGEYGYFGKAVRSNDSGVRYMQDGTLIGSSLLGVDIVRSFNAATGCGLPMAFACMSANPEALLRNMGAAGAGRLESGAKADLFIWNGDFSACKRIDGNIPGDSIPGFITPIQEGS
jgi:N-acetylglucosamine-6-phosphate deacetylase